MAKRETSYEAWLREEGIPIIEGYGVEDVTELPRRPWSRTGGQGAYIQLKGMEGFTGMYVGEIPAGEALNIERHLYEKIIYIIHGFGATEVWSGTNEKKKMQFEWQQGSLFAVPLNCSHRMINGSREPVIFLAVTSAPLMIDLLDMTSRLCLVATIHSISASTAALTILCRHRIGNFKGVFLTGSRTLSRMPVRRWWIPPRRRDMACE